MTLRAATLALVAALVGPAATGCHGCHEDHPYVPYTIGSGETDRPDASTAAAPATSAPAPPSDAGPIFTAEPAIAAPPGLARWPVAGLVLDAPDGSVFVSAIVRDYDGDGVADAFAIVRPAQGNDPGQLAFYQGSPKPAEPQAPQAPRSTFAPPAELRHDAACIPVDRLEAVGKRSVFVELGGQCPPRATSAPARWVAVLSGGATPRLRLAVTLTDPAGAPTLSVEGDASDRDGDGLEDVALRVTLEGGSAPLEPGPRVTATLAWLDRPAGLSRDAAATESSFASLAAQATARAKSARDAAAVPGLVAQTRALWGAVCADGGAPRLVGVAGTGAIPCGSTRALEDAGLA
jgi:hypothetical protein